MKSLTRAAACGLIAAAIGCSSSTPPPAKPADSGPAKPHEKTSPKIEREAAPPPPPK